jgi:hypothetical protein
MKPTNVLILLVAFALAATIGCGGDSDLSSTELIAGKESKSWHMERERNEAGIPQKTTPMEKQQMFVFNTAGLFTTSTLSETRSGSWTYENPKLTIQFDDNGEMRIYEVEDLDKNKMKLRSDDGSIFILTTK